MDIILYIAIFFLLVGGVFFLLNTLMGYKKDYISIDLDERYFNFDEYTRAIQLELESKGREVIYEGNGRFTIDGKTYLFIERNVSMGGAPLQRTILKPEK
ncbi:MAG: hypothetical protein ACQEUT_09185 [Bacillota bacterium]